MSIRLSIENYKIFMLTNWKMYDIIKIIIYIRKGKKHGRNMENNKKSKIKQ